jgi:WD40 repeat protein
MTGVEFAEQCPVRVDNSIRAVSINGSTLAIGVGKVVQLRHVETGEEIRTLQGHTDNVNSVCFSADGLTLASGSSDKTVRLWSTETGQEIKALQGHTSSVFSVCFSADGLTLASGSDDKTVRLWSTETGQEIKALQGHTEGVNSVCFSADGLTLASGSSDKTVRLWSIPDQQDAHDGHCSPSDYEWSSGPYSAGLTAKGCNLQHCAGLGEAKQRLLRYFGAADQPCAVP